MKQIKVLFGATLLVALMFVFSRAELSMDSERLNLEMRMQQRVEEALSKILPPGQFVIVIRVEPIQPSAKNAAAEKRKAEQNEAETFFLPGVPARRALNDKGDEVKDLVEAIKPEQGFQRFIRRILVTLVLDKDLPKDTVDRVSELTRQMLSLDSARGDTLEIQRAAFNKPDKLAPNGMEKVQQGLKSYWVIISLALILFCIMIFILFMFGPLRDFLNKFVQVLPTLRPEDTQAQRGLRSLYEAGMLAAPPPQYALPAAAGASSFSGSLQVENPNKTVLPFGFIREDHLGNLAILLSRESPEKAAIVLGYLQPDWISKVLARLDPAMQSEVASCLATTRQLLPEQVEDIEQDLKRRLDYLIGGPDRIIAVYESLDAEAQRRMLESLKASRPELVEELRARTLMFEDLEKLESPALKALLREVDLQTLVMALRGVSDAFRARVLEHLTEGKAQIVREELEMNEGTGGRAGLDAQKKIVAIAKRLEREGQIMIPQIEGPAPTARYGAQARNALKLPQGIQLDVTPAGEAGAPPPSTGETEEIRERIRRFMKKTNEGEQPTGTGD
ncbi:MAG: hypothetical protein JO102_00760 [Elusimicrobia bacterium]|nr:hypothetical protein [Elusimicrobiota bacterium]